MAFESFIPEVWAAQLQEHLDASLVLGNLVNRDYEGEVSAFGDTVNINKISDPTIGTYTRQGRSGATSIAPEVLDTDGPSLVIDQAKYFAIQVDDIDDRQARSKNLLDAGNQRAAVKLAEAVDTFVASLMTGAVVAANRVPADLTTDATAPDNAYTMIRKLRLKLDNANVPAAGRFLVVTPDVYSVLLDNSKFIDASQYGTNAPVMNGEVGRVLGFTVYVSTHMPAGTGDGTNNAVVSVAVAGTTQAITFAQQISQVEAYRPEAHFSDAIKGLSVYGGLAVQPAALALADVTLHAGA